MTTVAAYVALLLGAVLILAAPLLVAAAPPTSSRTGDVKIVKFNQIQDENSYKFEFENSDGQKRSEAGFVEKGTQGSQVIGQYSFIDGGKLYTVRYSAGPAGFEPTITVQDV